MDNGGLIVLILKLFYVRENPVQSIIPAFTRQGPLVRSQYRPPNKTMA